MQATDDRASLRFTLRLGFTLVELLVVITVIAILIALLLPALGKAEQQAKQVACLANMRDLGLAMVMYSQTNRYFPGPAAVFHDCSSGRPGCGGGWILTASTLGCA